MKKVQRLERRRFVRRRAANCCVSRLSSYCTVSGGHFAKVSVQDSGGNFGGVGGGGGAIAHLSSNCQFVGNFHFIGSSETHELFYKTVIISKFPTN